MSTRGALLLFALTSACACGGDVGRDAGRADAEATGDTDAPADVGPVGAAVRVVIDVHDDTPCPDWEIAVHPMPELPPEAGPTPTILWDWSPLDDLFLIGLTPGIDGYDLAGLSISATGVLWVRGPTNTDMTAVSRDGYALYHRRFDDPAEHRIAVSGAVQAPDDTVFFTVGGASTYAVHYALPVGEIARFDDIMPLMAPPGVTIGPHGRVGVGGPAVETCRLERRTRDLLIERQNADGTWERWDAGGSWTEPDGALVSVGNDIARRPVFEPDGTLGWRTGVEASLVVPRFLVTGTAVSGNTEILHFGSYSNGRFSYRVVTDGETVFEQREAPSAPLIVDGAGAVWRFNPALSPGGDQVQRLGHWPERPAPCRPVPGYENYVVAADGTFVCVATSGADLGTIFAMSPEDGSTLWRLSTPTGAFRSLVGPDLDGRIYATVHGAPGAPHIIAIQTNLRPPGDGFCDRDGRCNRHRSRWAHDYRPRP